MWARTVRLLVAGDAPMIENLTQAQWWEWMPLVSFVLIGALVIVLNLTNRDES